MSSQKGNDRRNRAQKHKNTKAFKNDLYDTSHTTKKINSLEFYGICDRCKDIIDWKVKYKKYKPLTTLKKCVKCLEKKVKDAYYIVCKDCCINHKICSKCSKPVEKLEFGESEKDKQRREEEFFVELKSLNERQRRKLLRLLEKGAFSKEEFMDDPSLIKKNSQDSDDEFDEDDDDDFDEDEDDEEDYDDDEEGEEEEDQEELKNLPKDDGDEDYETFDEDEDEEEEDEVEEKKVTFKLDKQKRSPQKKQSVIRKK